MRSAFAQVRDVYLQQVVHNLPQLPLIKVVYEEPEKSFQNYSIIGAVFRTTGVHELNDSKIAVHRILAEPRGRCLIRSRVTLLRGLIFRQSNCMVECSL